MRRLRCGDGGSEVLGAEQAGSGWELGGGVRAGGKGAAEMKGEVDGGGR